MTNSTLTKLEAVVGTLLNNQEKVGLEDQLSTWGLDSLKTVELIVLLEKEFDIAFDNNDLLLTNFKDLKHILFLLEKNINRRL